MREFDKDKTQNEKLKLIKVYQDKGHYLAIEVKGNTGLLL